MKFSIEIIKETGTINVFTCANESKSEIKYYISLLLLSIIGILLNSYFIILVIVYFIQRHRSEVIAETLYMIKGLGFQITKYKRDKGCSNMFIDCGDIREVIVNEILTPYDVQIRLGIILIKSQELIVPFQSFKISLIQARQVYKCAKEILSN
jgi:GPI-GlcNAc transferase complex, PIG-H component